ncbi:uncharacterized protein MELLADRAFT_91902 [Melampsora larici-populina 98AG31]|uniref:Uncharacterized protein n=1 Tax=Melampsora larici-populina (strain 98AG31 / pathotype 3-4-7) TaxID=747676 RepID=F4S0S6_MELLP|nr:uncharacterized protein MELLADRAFT_91902 [Melampsora larici-populina 98AG31]EGG01635.1 hypothetical protein MELLADRAFT_91902 [Melampsora larici-populina 98AG31]
MMVTLLSTRQEIANYHQAISSQISQLLASAGSGKSLGNNTWTACYELRQSTRLIATQCIIAGDVQAYTATADKEGTQEQLPRSLYAKTLDALLKNPSEWRKRMLPARYGKDPDPVDAKEFHKWLNIILKEIRKDLNKILLNGINLPNRVGNKRPSKLIVPDIDGIIVKAKHDYIGGQVRVREQILEAVDHLRRGRYAWLRMQAVHVGLNSADYSNRSIWAVVDDTLEQLRKKTQRYRYADFDPFNGEKTFAEIEKTTDFSLPTEEEVDAKVEELNQTFGPRLCVDEGAHEEPEDDEDHADEEDEADEEDV